MNIRISFLGLGVVGSKLMEYFRNHVKQMNHSFDSRISIGTVFVQDTTKKRNIDTSDLILTDDPYKAIQDADIVIDCMGGKGSELTRELILSSIREHKAVIMSSKKSLAQYGEEIHRAVQTNGTSFHYDATVGGCIPISSTLAHMGRCETINRIYGICNATSNFILGEMENSSSYQTALLKAKKQGIAENDPEEDVDGLDALYKSVIMMGFGMGHWVDCESIIPVSIRHLTKQDIQEAERQESILKPMFSIEYRGGEYTCHIGPQLVPKVSILAPVRGKNNIIVIEGSESGERAFYGQGAGANPTASAMFDDLMKTLQELKACPV